MDSRTVGREAKFIKFLHVLCQCNGKAVRPNQWRVCNLLLQEAPELLFKLSLRTKGNGEREVCISGDPKYFPLFKDAPSQELSQWLASTTPENEAYFEHSLELLALLVRGRNLKNVAAVRKLLPYELVEGAVTSPQLNRSFLHQVAQFVQIAIDAYVDHEPHELMTRVKTVSDPQGSPLARSIVAGRPSHDHSPSAMPAESLRTGTRCECDSCCLLPLNADCMRYAS